VPILLAFCISFVAGGKLFFRRNQLNALSFFLGRSVRHQGWFLTFPRQVGPLILSHSMVVLCHQPI